LIPILEISMRNRLLKTGLA